jgi:predicted RNase H-like HicB family nuclease
MPLSMEQFDRLMDSKPEVQFTVDVPAELREAMTFGGAIAPRISRREAYQVPAVLRARNLICIPAGLPIHIRDNERRIATPTTLLEQIDPDVPNIVTFAETYEDLLCEGISWWYVTERGWHGYPTYAQHLSQDRVHVSGMDLPILNGFQTIAGPNRVFVDGRPVRDEDVIRFDSPNPALLVNAARAIRACLMLDTTAALYADEPLPLGYFTPRDGERVRENDEDITKLLDKWAEARRARATGYIPAALKLETPQFNAEQIQLADQRQHAVLEIARAAGIDPEDLGVSTTSRTYQNAEQRRQDLIDFTLAPYVKAIEQRLSMRDVLPRGYRAQVNFDGFLRADTKTRFEAHKIALDSGFETLDEVRELENRPNLTPAQRAANQPPMTVAPQLPTNGQRPMEEVT